MVKLSHSALIALSGLIWLLIGFMLLSMGINFIVGSILNENLVTMSRPFLDAIAPYVGGREEAALTLVLLGLAIGFMKGRVVLSKTVARTVARILTMPNPAPLSKIYPKSYYFLLGGMVLLGFLVRFLTNDIRGFVDVAIGAALINGAMLYFRQAYKTRLDERMVKVTVSKE